MKKRMTLFPITRRSIASAASTAALLLGFSALPALADTEVEYEAGEGYHEEEWYDPSDWFNEDGMTSYESDWADSDWTDSYWDGYYVDPYQPVVYTYYVWDPYDSDWSEDKPNRESPDKKQSQRGQAGNTSKFSGTVDGFRSIDLTDAEGVREKHTFMKVTLANGDSRIISLGGKVDKGDLSLSQGYEIEAHGEIVKVDGRKVLLADKIKAGGETFSIKDKRQPDIGKSGSSQEWRSSSKQGERGDRGMMITRKGTVEDSTTVEMDGKRGDNLIVRVEMKDGRSCVVDLGSGTKLKDLGIDQGDSVMIKGRKTDVNGKKLLVANKVRVEGESKQIRDKDRSGEREYRSDRNRSNRGSDSSQASNME